MNPDSIIILFNVLRIIAAVFAVGSFGFGAYAGWRMSQSDDTDDIASIKKQLLVAGGVFIGAALLFVVLSFLMPDRSAGPTVMQKASTSTADSVTKKLTEETAVETEKSKSCNANKLGDSCQADSGSCSADEYCGKGDCLCHPLQSLGGSCSSGESSSSCQADSNACAEYLECDVAKGCLCSGDPVITSISPTSSSSPSGAIGSFMTISGLYFGSSTGVVYFSDNKGEMTVPATSTSSINPDCVNDWQDKQIVVAVPKDAKPGPIKVVRQDKGSDATDDDRGPHIGNFALSSQVRPSLCSVTPDRGYIGNPFALKGDRLSGVSNILFSFGKQYRSADNISGQSASSIKGSIPSLNMGNRSVSVVEKGTFSNSLNIDIERDQSRPYITDISPEEGTNGQYITVYGENFGLYNASTSLVRFYDPITKASTTFDGRGLPNSCSDHWWYNNHIVVKAPVNLTVGTSYQIQVSNNSSQSSPFAEKTFTVRSGQTGPGICYIDPFNGQIGFPITVFGDNFGGNRGGNQVNFFSDKPGIFSPLDSWSNQKFEVRVPAGAVNGPVSVKNQTGKTSNSLPVRIGKCSSDNDCDALESCCEEGSFWAGTCRRDGFCEQVTPGKSGYGWTFSTSLLKPDSCGGYSVTEGCTDSDGLGTCPNSPGKCQINDNKIIGNGCGDGYCSYNYAACVGNKCKYDSSANRCEVLGSACDSSATTTSQCPNGFDCQTGKCVSVSPICPGGSSCNAEGQCSTGQATCECCCQVGNDQSCCTGLTCTPGGCGAKTPDMGLCTGCARDLDKDGKVGTKEEVDASNDACNCVAGENNRYCDVYDPKYPQGVCRDRAKIGDNCRAMIITATTTCNNAGFSPCEEENFCDPSKKCTCQKFAAAGAPCSSPSNDIFTSNPYSAGDSKTCANNNPPCNENEGFVCDADSCTCQLKSDPGTGSAGSSCKSNNAPSCSDGVDSCMKSYGCLSESKADCRCCCNPTPDSYGKVATNPYGLSCYADKEPCSGVTRGLYCGCTSDEQCDGGDYAGCSSDTCCRERPMVESVTPADGSEGVCRNSMISATFNQLINPSTLASNFLVIGDYGSTPCPKGKQFLSDIRQLPTVEGGNKVGVVGKVLAFFKHLLPFFWEPASAADPVSDQHNYCAIPGNVGDYTEAGASKTVAIFSPSEPFDAGVKHYVILKGDSNTKDAIAEGISNEFGVGFSNPSENTFGSMVYKNAYVWSFTTLSQGSDHGGMCVLDHLKMTPSSYLFQTSNNDNDEDDATKSSVSFDTAKDKDKLFVAQAISTNGQNIVPVSGYSWDWSWSIDNTDVVNFMPNIAGLANNERLIQAMTDVRDSETYVNVNSVITQDNYMNPATVGKRFSAYSHVWVFICDNPWPPMENDTWSPWTDNSNNCTVGNGSCGNSGFQIYYCRDSGKLGTADDLPAILSDQAVIRRSNGQEMLKEYYFLREDLPATSTSFRVYDAGIGRSVQANWSGVPGAVRYKVYYGNRPRGYTYYVATTTTSIMINGLNNGNKYYFALTSLNNKNVESNYSDEITAIPTDSVLPPAPIEVKATTTSMGNLSITWKKANGDIKGYKVYYGSKSKNYGGFEDVGKTNSYTPTGLVSGGRYYFVVTVIDKSNNESAYSEEVSAIMPKLQ